MTHVFFDSDKINWSPYLASQQVGQGYRMVGRGNLDDEGNKEFFRGLRYVRGYGVGTTIRGALGSVGRFLLPIATNIMETAGNEADATLGRIRSDMSQGQPIIGSVKEQAKKGLSNIGRKIQQCGKGHHQSYKTKKPKPGILKDISTLEIPNNYKDSGLQERKRSRRRIRRRDYLDLD